MHYRATQSSRNWLILGSVLTVGLIALSPSLLDENQQAGDIDQHFSYQHTISLDDFNDRPIPGWYRITGASKDYSKALDDEAGKSNSGRAWVYVPVASVRDLTNRLIRQQAPNYARSARMIGLEPQLPPNRYYVRPDLDEPPIRTQPTKTRKLVIVLLAHTAESAQPWRAAPDTVEGTITTPHDLPADVISTFGHENMTSDHVPLYVLEEGATPSTTAIPATPRPVRTWFIGLAISWLTCLFVYFRDRQANAKEAIIQEHLAQIALSGRPNPEPLPQRPRSITDHSLPARSEIDLMPLPPKDKSRSER